MLGSVRLTPVCS